MIPRSRKIEVDGHKLAWSLPTRRPRALRCWEPGPSRNAATLTVQNGSGRGRVAQTTLTWVHGTAVTPEVVAIVVRRMLAAGWVPSETGSPFLIDTVVVEELHTREAVARSVMDS